MGCQAAARVKASGASMSSCPWSLTAEEAEPEAEPRQAAPAPTWAWAGVRVGGPKAVLWPGLQGPCHRPRDEGLQDSCMRPVWVSLVKPPGLNMMPGPSRQMRTHVGAGRALSPGDSEGGLGECHCGPGTPACRVLRAASGETGLSLWSLQRGQEGTAGAPRWLPRAALGLGAAVPQGKLSLWWPRLQPGSRWSHLFSFPGKGKRRSAVPACAGGARAWGPGPLLPAPPSPIRASWS